MELNIHQVDKNALYLALRMYGKKLRESHIYSEIEREEFEKLNKIRPIPSESPHYLVSKTKDNFKHEIKPFSIEDFDTNNNDIDDLLVIKSVGNKLEVTPVREEVISKGYSITYEDKSSPLVETPIENKGTEVEDDVLAKAFNFAQTMDEEEHLYDDDYQYEYEEDVEEEIYYDEEDETYYDELVYDDDYNYDETVNEILEEELPVTKPSSLVNPLDIFNLQTKEEKESKEVEKQETIEEVQEQPKTMEQLERKHKIKTKKKTKKKVKNITPKLQFLEDVQSVQKDTTLTGSGRDKKFIQLVEENMILLLRSKLNMTNKDVIMHYKEYGMEKVASRVLNKLIRESKVLTRNGKIRLY